MATLSTISTANACCTVFALRREGYGSASNGSLCSAETRKMLNITYDWINQLHLLAMDV